ncbi:MAG: ribonuclease HI family protein [Thermodesulfobacteriota bacterium]
MPSKPPPTTPPTSDNLTQNFLNELASTLDLEKTIKKLNISREDARGILRTLGARRGKKAAPGLYELYVDGASRGNPGESGAGAVIKDHSGRAVKRLKKYLGTGTNNMAEYKALIMGLEAARSMGVSKILVYADSELMVRQLSGVYKVKSETLLPLYERARGLLSGFSEYKIKHIPRDRNKAADNLANEAIDSHR